MPKQEDIKGLQVQLDDGSIWQAHLDGGEVVFDFQIKPPGSNPKGELEEDPSTPTPPSLEELLDGMKSKSEKDSEKKSDESDMPESAKKEMSDKVFRAKLSSIMLDNMYDRRLRGRTKGKLDMKALPKVPTLSRSVFTQKTARKNKAYNICLVVDESGSMRGMQQDKYGEYFGPTRAESAGEISAFLAKNFEGINVNLSIIGFNKYISVIKDWNMKADTNHIYEHISTMNHGNGGAYNDDLEAINRGYHMFKTAPKGNNIMIMISDGMPCEGPKVYIDAKGKEENGEKYSKTLEDIYDKYGSESRDAFNTLNAQHPDVVKIGVGIFSECWQMPTNFEVNSLDELKPKILSILKSQIKRG